MNLCLVLFLTVRGMCSCKRINCGYSTSFWTECIRDAHLCVNRSPGVYSSVSDCIGPDVYSSVSDCIGPGVYSSVSDCICCGVYSSVSDCI